MNDQVENLSKELDISIDIANAVNKSLKETNVDPTFRSNTPIQSQSEDSIQGSETADNTSYQLWNHHYVEAPSAADNSNITEILEDWNFIDDNVRNKRRTSMEDIFKVRHYLNPRSSFTNSGTNSRCWVTIITQMAEISCAIALNSSLRAHDSKLILCVVIPKDWNIPLPQLPFLTFVKLPKVTFADKELTLLTLWNHLDYEFCCFLSPFAILQTNIDEMLLNDEIFLEIDNETCVFLTNDTYQRKEDIVFLLFKPSVEIGTAVDEFLKVYSGDSAKLAQLQETDPYDALNTLFGEAWGFVGRDICQTLYDPSLSSNASILNYKKLEPWKGNHSGICQLWWDMYKGDN
ncbi:Ids2p [Kluyveromyces lactis]|uniref:KLLA0A05907p n=1 Tax=Kluyveromyces lactis (strain ATCC 8585 / CBS 2359 / DSM 70799 / NBRC 1267 / NRRL Y-1140 / WM37) TaxID=284590 RepID=Q6CXS6_KLULA|nr:uncharacterized protein KLLA0_A05907g [Kluyveromyces lactis]CAH02851.1 KLLA0A05907p [Kluyveromyces lactis]|eukprot:XP_451263.1 uncharacterized protein KLLA0_A05907g [Kluyveromyces lactis]